MMAASDSLDCAHPITSSVKKFLWKWIDSVSGHVSHMYTGRTQGCTRHLLTTHEHGRRLRAVNRVVCTELSI